MAYVINYRLEVESPLLISSGVGSGGRYDRLTVMENGWPFVPPSSIRGSVKAVLVGLINDLSGAISGLWSCPKQSPDLQPSGQDSDSQGAKNYCSQRGDPQALCPLCRIFGAPGGLKRGSFFPARYIPNRTG